MSRLRSPSALIFQADAAGVDPDVTIKGFLGGYGPRPTCMSSSATRYRSRIIVLWFCICLFTCLTILFHSWRYGRYVCSMTFLAYQTFVTGMQATLMSQVTCGMIGPALILLNAMALGNRSVAQSRARALSLYLSVFPISI